MADNFLERQRRDYEERKRKLGSARKTTATSVKEILKRSREKFNNE